jgi:fructan beta-fructosidase
MSSTGNRRHSEERSARAFERPHVHFTPTRGWLNDPNGLVHAHGTFHLYYQHHPHDTSWGPMHWGHAISSDLVSWHHRPIALAPDEHGTIFSGSAVVDHDGTAGLGAGTLVALFTYHRDDTEALGLAWSRDHGETFTKHPAPILEAPAGVKDFRDPKILRYTGGPGHWVMLVAAGRAIWIYTSADLRAWTHTGTVSGVFCEDGTWETPELLRFELDGDTVWVLVVSIGDGAPAGGSGVQAVVGAFDGTTFTPFGDAFWVDHGPSFYAPQAWNGAPDGRAIWVGWMGNWHTVNELPAAQWRGQMSIPREVTLRRCESGYRLVQRPVPELARSRGRSFVASGAAVVPHLGAPLALADSALELVVGVAGAVGAGARAAVEIECVRGDQIVTIRPDRSLHHVVVAVADGAREFTHRGPLAPAADRIDIRVLLDVASIEIFAGMTTISSLLSNIAGPWSVAIRFADRATRSEHVEAVEAVEAVEHLELHALAAAAAGTKASS